MITRALPANTNKLYVRAWFYMSRKLGMNPGANHETLIGLRRISGDAGNEIRFGEAKGAIGFNMVPGDGLVPKEPLWGMGPVVPANEWACIEVAFLGDQPQHTAYAWHRWPAGPFDHRRRSMAHRAQPRGHLAGRAVRGGHPGLAQLQRHGRRHLDGRPRPEHRPHRLQLTSARHAAGRSRPVRMRQNDLLLQTCCRSAPCWVTPTS